MTGELFHLALQGIKRRRRSSLLLFAVLCLSFAFAIVTLSVSGSMKKTNEEYRLDTFGTWQGAVPDGLAEDEDFFREQSWLSELGIVKSVGGLSSGGAVKAFGTADETFLSMGRLGLQDGRWPKQENEIVIEAAALSALGFDYTLGQKITLQTTLPTKPAQGELSGPGVTVEHTYTLCGVLREYSSLWKSSLAGWPGELPSALMTEETAGLLRKEAEAESDRMEKEARTAIDEAELSGEEPDPALSELLDLTLEGPTLRYFFTAVEGMENEMKNAVNDYLATFTAGEPRGKMQENTLAFGDNGDEEINTFYAGLLFGVTVLAVLCIYAIQLQKQVRQYALFRSIGIKKSQLRKLVFFETLLLCVPAVILGTAFGAAGTWAVLKLAVYSGSAPMQISIPWGLLWPLLLAWFLGIVLARLVILQLALHVPLTGRIAMENKKARRVRRARKALIAALSALLCGAVVFTVTVSMPNLNGINNVSAYPSYTFDNSGKGQSGPLITEEHMQELKSIPGVSRVQALGVMEAELTFAGMENNEFFNLAKEVNKFDMGSAAGHLSAYKNGLGVWVFVVPEENYESYLRPGEIGLDTEAFRKGDQIVMSFPQNAEGKFYLNAPIYVSEEGELHTETRVTEDMGLRAGDAVGLEFYRKVPDTTDAQNRESIGKIDVTVGAVLPVAEGKIKGTATQESSLYPYVVWCSADFAKRVFSGGRDLTKGMKGAVLGRYSLKKVEKGFGYTQGEIFTDKSAGYLSTDTVAAQLCQQNGFTFHNQRELFASAEQMYLQALILLLSGGGCTVLVLILLLCNTQTMEAEREKRKYGILQALGLSGKQLKSKLMSSALFRGLLGVLAGWAVMSGYVLYSAYQTYLDLLSGPEELRLTMAEALGQEIHSYMTAGMTAWAALLLTALAVALTVVIALLAQRPLLRGGPMEKLREEE